MIGTRAMNRTTATATTTTTGGRLARIIGANGWFCLVSGIVLLLGAGIFGDWFELPWGVIAAVGLVLVPYGMLLVFGSRATRFDRRLALMATAGDLLWVVAAAMLVVIPDTMGAAGKWALAVVSLAVLGFAVMQIRELRHPD